MNNKRYSYQEIARIVGVLCLELRTKTRYIIHNPHAVLVWGWWLGHWCPHYYQYRGNISPQMWVPWLPVKSLGLHLSTLTFSCWCHEKWLSSCLRSTLVSVLDSIPFSGGLYLISLSVWYGLLPVTIQHALFPPILKRKTEKPLPWPPNLSSKWLVSPKIKISKILKT